MRREEIESELFSLLDKYENLLNEKLVVEIESEENDSKLADYVQETSEEVSKNPEKFSPPCGSSPARYVVMYVVKSQNEYRKLFEKKQKSKISLMKAWNKVKIAEARIEVLKCLLKNS